jgi:hypothetical protein
MKSLFSFGTDILRAKRSSHTTDNFVKLVFVDRIYTCLLKGLRELPAYHLYLSSVADPDLGSGIQCLFDPWSQDPE